MIYDEGGEVDLMKWKFEYGKTPHTFSLHTNLGGHVADLGGTLCDAGLPHAFFILSLSVSLSLAVCVCVCVVSRVLKRSLIRPLRREYLFREIRHTVARFDHSPSQTQLA